MTPKTNGPKPWRFQSIWAEEPTPSEVKQGAKPRERKRSIRGAPPDVNGWLAYVLGVSLLLILLITAGVKAVGWMADYANLIMSEARADR